MIAKAYDTGTGLRARKVEETLASVGKLIDKYRITFKKKKKKVDTRGFHVIDAVVHLPNKDVELTVGGKGLSPEQAKVSACMEAYERYFWYCPDEARVVVADHADVADRVRPLRHGWCYTCPFRTNTCEAEILAKNTRWVEASSLATGQEFLVDIEAVHRTLHKNMIADCRAGRLANGLAAGNTYEEAVLHGIYEVIERNAAYPLQFCAGMVSFWGNDKVWSNARYAGNNLLLAAFVNGYDWPALTRYPRVSLDGYPHRDQIPPALAEAMELYLVSDDFLGLPIYTFFCQIEREKPLEKGEGVKVKFARGLGTHLDPTIALTRTIGECLQKPVWDPVGRPSRDGTPVREFGSFPNISTGELEADLELVRRRAQERGKEWLVSVLADDFGFPVVNVNIPGLPYL